LGRVVGHAQRMSAPTRQRALLAAVVAICAGLPLRHASAQQVTAIRIADTPDAQTSTVTLPEGIERFYVAFDYAGAANTSIEVEIVAPGRLVVFENTNRYTGTGTRPIEVTGAEVLTTIVEQLALLSDETVAALQRAESQAQTREYLDSAQAFVTTMRVAVELVSRLPASAVGVDVAPLQSDLDELNALAEVAAELTADQDAERKEIASEMLGYARSAAELTEELESSVDNATDVPVPPTDGPQEGTGYTVTLRVNNSPSMSEEMWVTDKAAGDATPRTTAEATQMAAASQTATRNAPTLRAATMTAAVGMASAPSRAAHRLRLRRQASPQGSRPPRVRARRRWRARAPRAARRSISRQDCRTLSMTRNSRKGPTTRDRRRQRGRRRRPVPLTRRTRRSGPHPPQAAVAARTSPFSASGSACSPQWPCTFAADSSRLPTGQLAVLCHTWAPKEIL
jgi:hypothetical protein